LKIILHLEKATVLGVVFLSLRISELDFSKSLTCQKFTTNSYWVFGLKIVQILMAFRL
jgi:hypothetical protein